MADYKANKVERRPYPEGTRIDVIMRDAVTFSGVHLQTNRVTEGEYAGHLEVIGTEVGNPISDWKLTGEPGDILAYRKFGGVPDGEE